MFVKKNDSNHNVLLNENNQLKLINTTLSDQVANYKKMVYKYQSDYNTLSKRVMTFCKTMLDNEYAANQIGGNNHLSDMDVMSMLSYTEESYKNSNLRQKDLLLDLTKILKDKELEIEGLKAQISRYIIQEKYQSDEEYISKEKTKTENQEKEVEKKDKPKEEPLIQKSPVASANNGVARVIIIDDEEEEGRSKDKTPSNPEIKNIQEPIKETASKGVSIQNHDIENEHTSKTIENNSDNVAPIAHVIDLNEYMSKMTDLMWEILYSIGHLGYSESKDIKGYVNQKDFSYNTALNQLKSMGIIESEKINTGWRWFYSYELSSTGKRIYVEKYKVNSIECEKQILRRDHATALHGYCIKDAAQILKDVFHYDDTSISRKVNTIQLRDEKYIPDIIARNKKMNVVDYYEIELGHHMQKDFNKKCDKMRMVTKDLYFVVPTFDVMNRVLIKQIGQWVLDKGGKDKLKGTTVYVTTMSKLIEGNWENIYPF